MELEKRFLNAALLELRVEEDSDDGEDETRQPRIVGLIPYNTLSQDLGGFVERIMPTAFANTLASGQEVTALLNHDWNQRIAKRSVGSLRLRPTPGGMAVSMRPTAATAGRDAVALVKDELIPGFSFGFYTTKDNWTTENGQTVRELHDVDLREVSVVYDPAYDKQPSLDLRTLNVIPLEVRARIPAITVPVWQPSLDLLAMMQRQKEAETRLI